MTATTRRATGCERALGLGLLLTPGGCLQSNLPSSARPVGAGKTEVGLSAPFSVRHTDNPDGPSFPVSGGSSPELVCFPVPGHRFGGVTSWWDSVRALGDIGALQTVLEDMTPDGRGVTLDLKDTTLWALVEQSPEVFGVVRIVLDGERPANLGDALVRAVSVDPAQIAVDVLTPTQAEAAALDLTAATRDVLAVVTQSLKERADKLKAEREAALNAVFFPKAGMSDAALVKAAKAFFASETSQTGIAPAQVKLVRVASTSWSVRKDDAGFITGQVADVAVGYKLADGSCAYALWQAQRDYTGAGNYKSRRYMNGFKTIPVAVRCDRIK